jgi:hypothetical protein
MGLAGLALVVASPQGPVMMVGGVAAERWDDLSAQQSEQFGDG